MTKFIVYHFEPYEGESEVFEGTKEELVGWVNGPGRRRRDYRLDACSVFELTDFTLESLLQPT